MKNFWVSGVLFLFFVLSGVLPAVMADEGLQPLAESQAYQDFLKKPANDFSKMFCLLNYFRTAPVIVQFEGIDYTAEFAYPFGLVYLMSNYHNEKPEHWAKKHCYRSIFSNKIIYFKFQDGSSRPARDVILEKFEELEEVQKKPASKA
jgi:hypothetical protein